MEGFIKFVGTGGARVVVAKQARSTGGLWLKYRSTNLYIDPGPGALVRLRSSKNGLDPSHLDGIILTHKHLDHANDVNVMIEAMAEGGFKKRGHLFCPGDAIEEDPVVFGYVRSYLEGLDLLRPNGRYQLKDVDFTAPARHIHPVETYGLVFHLNKKIGIIADTRFWEGLPDVYGQVDILVANVLRVKPITPSENIDHLSVDDFKAIITAVQPQLAVMTHFGMNFIKEQPRLFARKIKDETGIDVIAAYDGMVLEF
jgi:phosphoribosyl 1,2-cyclic phosphodiesterase